MPPMCTRPRRCHCCPIRDTLERHSPSHMGMGNGSKPSDTSFLPIGRTVQTTTNLTPGNTNSCELTQPHAKSPAPTANATFRVLTDLSLTTSTAPAFYPLLCLSEPPFGTLPLMVLGGLAKSSNPLMSSDATSYDSSITQVLP